MVFLISKDLLVSIVFSRVIIVFLKPLCTQSFLIPLYLRIHCLLHCSKTARSALENKNLSPLILEIISTRKSIVINLSISFKFCCGWIRKNCCQLLLCCFLCRLYLLFKITRFWLMEIQARGIVNMKTRKLLSDRFILNTWIKCNSAHLNSWSARNILYSSCCYIWLFSKSFCSKLRSSYESFNLKLVWLKVKKNPYHNMP